ncbi:aldo-keto reductase [Enterobacter asburiae]|uniref:Aldo-keto reductase n=1 Tax=Enterobacter asburiae TaxID=61645 RepID=A0A376FF10_ENTAS|nr:aldo-keto reductase [Enterobacter asburiae]
MSWHPYHGRYESMQYRYCGKSGLRLPALSLGLWHSFGHVQPLDAQRALLRKAFDLGITHFDLANNYGPPAGSAEENFGRLLREDFAAYRDELIISTKAGYDMWPGPYGSGGSRKYLLASLDQSLKRLGVDYVDIFYSHRVDENTPMEETALCAGPRRAERQSAVCRHFLLLDRSHAENGRAAARVEDPAADPPAVL